MDWIVLLWGLAVLVVLGGFVVVCFDARRTKEEWDELSRRYAEGSKESGKAQDQ